jgi:hypothetical protein
MYHDLDRIAMYHGLDRIAMYHGQGRIAMCQGQGRIAMCQGQGRIAMCQGQGRSAATLSPGFLAGKARSAPGWKQSFNRAVQQTAPHFLSGFARPARGWLRFFFMGRFMNNRLICLLVMAITISFVGATKAGEVVERFNGHGSGETAEFEVEAPWLLDWMVNGDYPQMLAIEVSLIDAKSGTHAGYVLKTKSVGNGVRLFDQGGRYRLKIDSAMTRWNFKIEQLSREEAALYTPVEKDSM